MSEILEEKSVSTTEVTLRATCLPENLAAAIEAVKWASNAKSRIPILAMVLLKSAGPRLSVSACNLDAWATAYCGARIEGNGATVVPPTLLLDICKAGIQAGEALHLTLETTTTTETCVESRCGGETCPKWQECSGYGRTLHGKGCTMPERWRVEAKERVSASTVLRLRCGDWEQTILPLDAADYPIDMGARDWAGGLDFNTTGGEVLDTLKAAAGYAEKQNRYSAGGGLGNIRFDGLTIQALDGYRAYSKEIGGLGLEEPVYLDAGYMSRLAVSFRKFWKQGRRDPALRVQVAKDNAGADTWVKFEHNACTPECYAVIRGGIPWATPGGVNPVDALLVQEYPTRVTVDRKAFLAACGVLLPFARENKGLAQIAANGRLDLRAAAATVGDVSTFLDCITEGPDAAVHVHIGQARDAARNVKGELLDIGLSASASVPLAFYEFCESTPAAVVMPANIQAAA